MVDQIVRIGRQGSKFCSGVGQAGIVLFHTTVRKPRLRKLFPLLIEQLYHVGVMSLVIIVVASLFIGMVVGLQGYNTLNKFGATAQLGQLLALSITRELGPVVTALLFAGRAGSALTAEIGLMKATEQLSSMGMMGVDPLWRVIAPRLWAGIITMPILALIFAALAVLGGYLVGVEWLGIDPGSFWSNMQSAVDYKTDVLSGIYKSFAFGIAVTWIAIYQGFACVPTSAGISQATTRTVVFASLATLGLDFILTTMMIGGW